MVKHIVTFSDRQQLAPLTVTVAKELMLGGSPITKDWPVFDSANGVVSVGVWESEHYHKIKQHPNEMEYCYILEGEVRISDSEGNSTLFKAGDAFVVEPGFDGAWESLGKVRKHYIICQC